MNDRTNPQACPNPRKNEECWVCGGKYICTEPWRKKRTVKERIEARAEHLKRKEKA